MRLNPKHPEVVRAVGAMKRFFKDKTWWCGGEIPKTSLLTERNVKMVLYLNITQSVKIGYRALAKVDRPKHHDIKTCVYVLHECERLGIAQPYVGGLFLLYLKLCEKVEL